MKHRRSVVLASTALVLSVAVGWGMASGREDKMISPSNPVSGCENRNACPSCPPGSVRLSIKTAGPTFQLGVPPTGARLRAPGATAAMVVTASRDAAGGVQLQFASESSRMRVLHTLALGRDSEASLTSSDVGSDLLPDGTGPIGLKLESD